MHLLLPESNSDARAITRWDRSVEAADSRTTECASINSKEPTGDSSRVRLSRIVAHSAAGPFPQESVLTHRRPSDGLCRPRWQRTSVSMKQATASLARVRFVMSDRRPSGHRTRHMPRWAASGTTLGLRGLKRHPPRCGRPRRAIAPLRAPGRVPLESAQAQSGARCCASRHVARAMARRPPVRHDEPHAG